MSILPQINIVPIVENKELGIYKEILWEEGPVILDGKPLIVQGIDAIKVWIYKALKTERFRYGIYSWDYGCEIDTLINKGFSKELVIAEVERYISEALLINEYILSINYVNVSFKSDLLYTEVSVQTIYGEVIVDV